MLYIYMLGYDVDFGHMETVALISAPKYAEKQVHTLSQFCLHFLYISLYLIVAHTIRFCRVFSSSCLQWDDFIIDHGRHQRLTKLSAH
jgi:hypothetical protein